MDVCVGRIVGALVNYEVGRMILRYAQNDKGEMGGVPEGERVGRMAQLELWTVGAKVAAISTSLGRCNG